MIFRRDPQHPRLKWQGLGGGIDADKEGNFYLTKDYTAKIEGKDYTHFADHYAPIKYWQEQQVPLELLAPRDFETPHEAMEREFTEESGVKIARKRWHCFHIKFYKTIKIYYFVAFGDGTELQAIINYSRFRTPPIEGPIGAHALVDVLFDPSQYTFDIPYLIAMLYREHRAGMLLQLDPEGVNTSGKT